MSVMYTVTDHHVSMFNLHTKYDQFWLKKSNEQNKASCRGQKARKKGKKVRLQKARVTNICYLLHEIYARNSFYYFVLA